MKSESPQEEKHQAPPFFKSWPGMYLFVLGFMGFLILMMLWFSSSNTI